MTGMGRLEFDGGDIPTVADMPVVADAVRVYSDPDGLVELEVDADGMVLLPVGQPTYYVALPEADRPRLAQGAGIETGDLSDPSR